MFPVFIAHHPQQPERLKIDVGGCPIYKRVEKCDLHVEPRLRAYFIERDIKLGSEVAASVSLPMNGCRAYRFFDIHHSPFFSWTMKYVAWVPGDVALSTGIYPFSGDVGVGVGG